MKKAIITITFLFIITILLVFLLPNLNQSYIKQGKLYISKILAMNASIKTDDHGEYSDYLEIYNGYSSNINLSGYHLSDSEYVTAKWTFPDIEIKAKESLIVYASGLDTCDLINRICHTNFKLSSHGEVITLTDNHGNIISKVSYPEQYPDTFYAYHKGAYTYLTKEGKAIVKNNHSNKKYQLTISEYMTHNKRSYYDEYGNYYDWMEIYNESNEDYLLESIYVTDDATNLKKYELPKTALKSKEYLIVHFAGKKVNYEKGIYADFALSDKDKELIISNGKDIIDKVKIVTLVDNVSYGRKGDHFEYFTTPTPGVANTTASFKTWGGNDENS